MYITDGIIYKQNLWIQLSFNFQKIENNLKRTYFSFIIKLVLIA